MIHLTDKEIAVLKSLANNHYGDAGDGVWSWAINDSSTPSGLPKESLGGVVASLQAKGLLVSEEYEKNENVIWMKEAGKAEIIERKLVEGSN